MVVLRGWVLVKRIGGDDMGDLMEGGLVRGWGHDSWCELRFLDKVDKVDIDASGMGTSVKS